ncbi:MAG: phytanoyl-CoA dioxygenase family protein [Actinomycetota bacterium]
MASSPELPTLSPEQRRAFGRNGYLVVRGVVVESLLAELEAEVDAVVADSPPPADKVGFHYYVEPVASLPVADRVLRSSGVLGLAAELVAPLTIDHAFDHIQIATSIRGWDHEPGGGHIDGYGIDGQTEPHSFTLLVGIYLDDESLAGSGNLWVWPGSHRGHERLFRERGVDVLMGPDSKGGHACLLDEPPDLGQGAPVLAERGDVVLAHYLLAHNQSGNMRLPLRRIAYYRLAAAGHRERWAATHTDALLEFEPVRSALDADSA